ncbi:MAG: class I SAM-dependent methyltransferase [Anaerolineae bacterium]|nr:class I SAM-dependent methyltransferase [Anaerolineae bacterium]
MTQPPVCSYEGSRYSTEFWNPGRAYEDGAERVAMRALLPPQGRRLVEIGAGFGRLADLYTGYDTVVLFDYASTQLEQAVGRLGEYGPNGKPHYVYVQADFYRQPFVTGLFDTVTMVRTLHHAVDAPAVLRGISRILGPQGAFILEFANKHNLKALLRYLLRRQSWSPFTSKPVEFAALNFDFHPRWMWRQLEAAGLRRDAIRTVSHFRIGWLKRLMATSLLVQLDSWVQPTGMLWQWSPSVFVRSYAGAGRQAAAEGEFFRCPECGAPLGSPSQTEFVCSCGMRWKRQGLIYNFRDPA